VFIAHLCTRLVSTSNYSATANLHNSQITTAPAKLFPAYCVFIGGSSAACAQVLSSQASRAEMPTESVSYVTTGGQPASLSWNKAPFWGLRADLYYCLTVAGLLNLGAISDERTGLSFTIPAGFR
jgi:hypothetical protein